MRRNRFSRNPSARVQYTKNFFYLFQFPKILEFRVRHAAYSDHHLFVRKVREIITSRKFFIATGKFSTQSPRSYVTARNSSHSGQKFTIYTQSRKFLSRYCKIIDPDSANYSCLIIPCRVND